MVFFTSLLFFSLITVAFAEDLTIDYVSITEEINGINYTPTGSAPSYVCLDVSIRNPNGDLVDITYDTACTNVDPYYQFEGYIVDPFNAEGWTIQICNPSNGLDGVCVDRDFNISFSSLTNTPIWSPPSEEEEVFDIPLEPEFIPEEEIFTPDNPPENTCGFTGWTQDGERNVAYRCGVEVASYVIDNPSDSMLGDSKSEYNQTLDLRLHILKVIENIFKLLFG